MGADNYVTSCDLGVFVDQAAEPVAPQHANTRAFCRRTGSPGGRILVQRPVWPVGVVVIGVLTKDEPQMLFPDDQHLIKALTAGAADPAFGNRVRPWRPDRGLDDGGEIRRRTLR
jgi:hypothetical protein